MEEMEEMEEIKVPIFHLAQENEMLVVSFDGMVKGQDLSEFCMWLNSDPYIQLRLKEAPPTYPR